MNDGQNTFHIFQLNSITIKFLTTESHNLLIIIKRLITNFIKKENMLNVWSKTTRNLREKKYCEEVRICLLDYTILVYHTLTIAIFNHSLPISTDMTEIDSANKNDIITEEKNGCKYIILIQEHLNIKNQSQNY